MGHRTERARGSDGPDYKGIISVYNIYLLIFNRHMTLYIEIHYGNVRKNLKFLLN